MRSTVDEKKQSVRAKGLNDGIIGSFATRGITSLAPERVSPVEKGRKRAATFDDQSPINFQAETFLGLLAAPLRSHVHYSTTISRRICLGATREVTTEGQDRVSPLQEGVRSRDVRQ